MEFAREFDTNGELYKEESCIYADFLDCLVSLPEDERHASWAASVAGSSFKRLIADRFGGGKTSLDILVLEQSFYHDLGTMSLCELYMPFTVISPQRSCITIVILLQIWKT